MLFWSPPMNLPLITLPFFSSKESATAAGTTTHITKTNPNFCTRFILLVLYLLSVVSFRPERLPRQRAGIVDGRTGRQFLHLRSPPHGTLGCSTLGRAEHRSGMECARISCFAGLSWAPPIDSFLVAQFSDWRRLAVQTLIADSFFFRSQLDGFGLFGAVAINQICKIIGVDRIR